VLLIVIFFRRGGTDKLLL